MARPSKPVSVIKSEKKSHRTKAELEQREKAEAAVLSGKRCFERQSVKNDPIAHKEYLRLIKLMQAIGKDDALYAPEYNRYCELFSEEEFYKSEMLAVRAETAQLRELSAKITVCIETVSEKIESFEGIEEAVALGELLKTFLEQNNELLDQRSKLFRQISDLDCKIKQKREAMFAIEKENCMSVSAALRTIPKEAAKPEEEDALIKALREGQE